MYCGVGEGKDSTGGGKKLYIRKIEDLDGVRRWSVEEKS